MHVEHAYPIVTRMAESRPEEAVVASRYNFRVVTTGQEFVSVSDYPTCMVRGPPTPRGGPSSPSGGGRELRGPHPAALGTARPPATATGAGPAGPRPHQRLCQRSSPPATPRCTPRPLRPPTRPRARVQVERGATGRSDPASAPSTPLAVLACQPRPPPLHSLSDRTVTQRPCSAAPRAPPLLPLLPHSPWSIARPAPRQARPLPPRHSLHACSVEVGNAVAAPPPRSIDGCRPAVPLEPPCRQSAVGPPWEAGPVATLCVGHLGSSRGRTRTWGARALRWRVGRCMLPLARS